MFYNIIIKVVAVVTCDSSSKTEKTRICFYI